MDIVLVRVIASGLSNFEIDYESEIHVFLLIEHFLMIPVQSICRGDLRAV